MIKNGITRAGSGRAAQVRAEVDRLLTCIADGADHYSVLDISRESPAEKVRAAYCRAVEQLHPLKCQDIIEADGVMRWKLSEVFLRIVEAFSVLSSPGRRVEYDGMLNRRPITPLPMPSLPDPRGHHDETSGGEGQGSSKRLGLGNAFGHSELTAPRVADRRKAVRLALRLPLRVCSQETDRREVTETRNVSRGGVKFCLSQPPRLGTEFLLELPMPLALRNHDFHDGLYVVRAVVRYASPDPEGYVVGAEFKQES